MITAGNSRTVAEEMLGCKEGRKVADCRLQTADCRLAAAGGGLDGVGLVWMRPSCREIVVADMSLTN